MATFDDLYRPATLKVDRAKYHINDLNTRINEYLAGKPFELVIVEDLHAGERTHQVETKKPIPDEFALVIGDAIHNLRSALDVTIFGMVGAVANQPWKVQFPFSRNEKGLQAAIANAEIPLAGKNVLDTIEAAKPYGGGDELLYGLNSLDITDKHRLIISTARSAELFGDDLARLDPDLRISGAGLIRFVGTSAIIRVTFPKASRRERRANKAYTPGRPPLGDPV